MAERFRVSNGKLEERVEQRTHDLKEALQFQTATANFFKAISPSNFDLKICSTNWLNRLPGCARRTEQVCGALGETYRIAAEFGQRPEHLERLVGFPSARDETRL